MYIKIKSRFLLIIVCIFIIFFTGNKSLLAQEQKTDSDMDVEDTFIMEDMDVVESIGEGADSGIVEIPRDIIKYIPSGNGGVTDIISVAPGVQYDESKRGAGVAGEIAPANVSISGGNIYDNLFTVDGMNNSSLLDPNSSNSALASDVAGSPEKFFIDSWIIDDITLYDSDISAKFGDFQGGVVDVKTKKPGQELSGKVSYRGTNSYMTNYFLNETDLSDFQQGGFQNKQLKFFKNFFSASLDIPITSHGGLLLSYTRNWSTIPLKYFKDRKDQERTSESYYSKGIYNISGSSYIDLAVSYSPHYDTYFIRNTKDSQYEINGGGYFGAINYVNELKTHKITAHVDYSYSENSKKAPNEYKSWIASKYKDWGYEENNNSDISKDEFFSREGGFGSIDKEEQSVKASINNIYAYVEDDYQIERVNVRLGVRLNYEDYMNNFTASPRAMLSIDLLNNKKTIITGGYNRYYAQALLTYKLREGRAADIQEHRYTHNNEVQDWITDTLSSKSTYKFSDLETPYTDEFTASINQEILGSYINAKYIERHSKNGIASNRGETKEDGVFTLKEVDNIPKALKSARPVYPEYAKNMRIEGFVKVRFIVDKNCNTTCHKIVKATPSKVFENSALKAVEQWKFQPALKDGEKVQVAMVVKLNFKLDEK